MERFHHPTPPRPLTANARRRSWNEPLAVRAWWIAAIAMAIITAGLLAEQISSSRAARYRMTNWTRIDHARIEQIGDSRRETYRVTTDRLTFEPVKVSYVDAEGNPHELTGKLTAATQPVHPTQIIPILIN